jgi:hypothetical protein
MLGATVLAVAAAAAWSWSLGDSGSVQTVLIALLAGSLATAAPVVMRVGPDYWGVAVLFSGTARALVVLGLCYMMTPSNQAMSRAVMLPAAGAAAFLLAVESIAAVRILSSLERQKAALKAGH